MTTPPPRPAPPRPDPGYTTPGTPWWLYLLIFGAMAAVLIVAMVA